MFLNHFKRYHYLFFVFILYLFDIPLATGNVKDDNEIPVPMHIINDPHFFDTEDKKYIAKLIAKKIYVRKGDTFIFLMRKHGLSYKEAYSIYTHLKKKYDPAKKLKSGDVFYLTLKKNKDGKLSLSSLRLPLTFDTDIILAKAGKHYSTKLQKRQFETEWIYKKFAMNESILSDGSKAKIPASILYELIKQFRFEVDFQKDIQPNSLVEIVYETLYDPSRHSYHTGKIIYANIILGDKVRNIVNFSHANGSEEYYDLNGKSLKKALLKTPVKATRISSPFGPRIHPIYGYKKMHKGVDYAAPTGTPIYAAGNGRVVYAGRRGSYGIYIKIKHNGTYQTAYAHLSKIGKNIKKGTYVKQGDIIGYVGSTGASTGPHLHYEIIINGKQVDPLKVKAASNSSIAKHEKKQFKKRVDEIALFLDLFHRRVRLVSTKQPRENSATQ